MEITQDHVFNNFESSFLEFREAGDLTKQSKASKLASQIDILSLTRDGLSYLYEKSAELDELGFFEGTAWNEPQKLIPTLVKGTLRGGHPSSSYEILSELRLLRYASGTSSPKISQADAQNLLEEVLVHNLEFALNDISEETRSVMSDREIRKAHNLFGFLVSEVNLDGVYEKLAEEIELICRQRPVETRKARELIKLIDQRFDITGSSKTDLLMQRYIHAVQGPTDLLINHPEMDYQEFVATASVEKLEEEAVQFGQSMSETGLVSQQHATLLRYVVEHEQSLVPQVLDLNERGQAEWSKFSELITTLINELISEQNYQPIYGLSRMLGRNLFSRRPVRVGFENLRKIKINPQVEARILKSIEIPHPSVTALQYLLGGTMKVLGQPLGVGQGNNPTCQSARGISMWSQHAPAKLIDMIITVATQNNLIMRFENENLESTMLEKGLVQKLDHDLDVISVVLVPHLDRIYNEMMRRSLGRIEDPHKWVNPAMYGHWIQVGFASCYDYLSNSILDYNGFASIFYAAFHPDFNGQREILYPNPVGIFITSNKGDMLGFHAVSLLRVDRDEQGELRVYFLNPNNEGRQDWGQQIRPSVSEHGEKAGESSLPFEQFLARVYAFHFNALEVEGLKEKVPLEVVNRVKEISKASWGKSYVWNEQTKLW